MTTENVFEITSDAQTVLDAVGWSVDQVSQAVEDFVAQSEEPLGAASFDIKFSVDVDPLHIFAVGQENGWPGWQITVRTEREQLSFHAANGRAWAAHQGMSPGDRAAFLVQATEAEEELRRKYPGASPRLGPSKLVN